MKGMTRKQLAYHAGVSVKTLRNWLKPHSKKLEELGMIPRKVLLPPNVVKYIVDTFDIDVE
jgi:predicted transcriptional regulator